jgi:acyl-CoA thioesterase-2
MTGIDSAVLVVQHLGEQRWSAPHPAEDPEGRDVLFSGQILGQGVMIASAAAAAEKEIKSIHVIFARSGYYSAGPVEYQRESMQAGRAWASDTVTAWQGERLLARALVLLNTREPDLMRHSPAMPDVPAPWESAPRPDILMVYPGTEVREVTDWAGKGHGGSPVSYYWLKLPESLDTVAELQAAVAWSQPGFMIGTAVQAHRDRVQISDAHRTISTGVISHTVHFHDHPVPGQWLLVESAASFAGNGRVFGTGRIFSDGILVSTFGQDAMARSADSQLDRKTSL